MTAARLWPAALVSVLVLTVAANAWLLWAAHDRELGLEPDYYARAVAWDSTLAQREASARLGWQATASLTPSGGGTATLAVQLADRDGRPVDPEQCRAEIIPVALADRVQTVSGQAAAGGCSASVPLVYEGLHEIRLEARRGADRFSTVLRGTPGKAFQAP